MKRNVILIFCLILLGCAGSETKICPDKICADYSTQREAQLAFDADPDCLAELDNDNDKIACEELLNGGGSGSQGGGSVGGGNPGGGSTGGSNCPTTANCGCSNKIKSDCGGPCCRWVTGSGCKCK